jgi:hypothetical protein
MDGNEVELELEHGFRARPKRFGSTLVIERRRPLRLAAMMNEALSQEERDEWGDLEAWPGSLSANCSSRTESKNAGCSTSTGRASARSAGSPASF